MPILILTLTLACLAFAAPVEAGATWAVAGGYGEIGLDFRVSPRVVLGVDAAFHYVGSGQSSAWGWGGMNDLQDFSAFTVGTHAMFGLK